jgi:SpoVK/Ycf46/Vps4 family AAA+-type ATPase
MKKTIMTSLRRYEKNVGKTISNWKLFEGGTSTVGSTRKTTEPGLLMLFHGLPGTGKTFASAAIAQALGKKLLVTDMSRIQSMWVGESEKNVRRLFTIFERIVRRTDNPPVLLLNEADQFLTRRLSKTGSSVDVMYNTLQNLFLEAFEHLKGVMIATTNIRENLDPAFSRRFNLKLEFPLPEYLEREKLWKLHLPGSIPGAIDIDVKALARSYSFTGGQISIVVKNAATEAAGRKEKLQKLTQADIIKYSEIEMVSMFDRKKIKMGFYI